MEKVIIKNTSLAKAYDEEVKRWRFKNREALLTYAIAVLRTAETCKLTIEKRNELSMFEIYDTVECTPADHLID